MKRIKLQFSVKTTFLIRISIIYFFVYYRHECFFMKAHKHIIYIYISTIKLLIYTLQILL